MSAKLAAETKSHHRCQVARALTEDSIRKNSKGKTQQESLFYGLVVDVLNYVGKDENFSI